VIEDDTATYRSERMRSDFVANASHELRTPLASISGCIETLQGPAKNDPVGQERFLTIMSQQADRMTALIDDLLSLNRIEMRAHRTPTDCVNLETTVREAIDLARPSAEAANVTIAVEPSTSPATVRGDASELRQIAINLLQNAIKYGASGERVDVLLRDAVEGGVRMVELQVRDYGPGIAPSICRGSPSASTAPMRTAILWRPGQVLVLRSSNILWRAIAGAFWLKARPVKGPASVCACPIWQSVTSSLPNL
jgi:two-component system phosphate regulon sensor histidine kinase PhoR